MTDPAFIGRKVWRVTGKVKKADEPTYYNADRRVIWLAADGFDEAVEMAKDALTSTWSSQPHEARIVEITPVHLGKQPDQDTIYIPAATVEGWPTPLTIPPVSILAERFMDIEGAVARIQAILSDGDASELSAEQGEEIGMLATVLEHLVKGDPGCNDETPADRAVRAIRGRV